MTSPADRLARGAAKYDGGNGEAHALTEQALVRLAWRLRRSGKHCSRCDTEKPIGDFSRDSREKDGLRRYCRKCGSSANAAAYQRRKAKATLPTSEHAAG